MKKSIKKAFTLIELLVVIALIGIIYISVSNLNLKNISDRQRLEGFFYKLKTKIETIQTNALIGRAIHYDNGASSGIIVPEYWKINFNNSGSGKIITQYFSGTLKPYDEIIPEKFYSIITYKKDADWEKIPLDETGSIIIKSGNFTLSGITTKSKTLKVDIKYKQFTKTLFINTISGVIEEK